jgi:hypothetical protein
MRRGLAAVGALEIVVVDERPAPGGLDKEAGGPVTAHRPRSSGGFALISQPLRAEAKV